MPRFDRPALFARLLDRQKGGHFTIRPASGYRVERRYLDETNVLETTFITGRGRLRLVDLMPVASESQKRHELWPEHQVLRVVECLGGQVEVEVVCDPRPGYGKVVPRLTGGGTLGFCWEHRAEGLLLRSEIPLQRPDAEPGVRGGTTLRQGERRYVSLVYTDGEPAVIPTFGADAERKIECTLGWWRDWASRCRYEGPHRAAVVRSALTLKLMTYAPSGAVIAAPTTSLPEELGGVRNWDYRYCWLRDASLTLQALSDLSYREEADAFFSWMLHSTRLSWPELQVLYDVHGETRLQEQELAHLDGYAGSRPVRVGNAAEDQLQLDTYGEVADATFEYVRRGGTLDGVTSRLLVGLGKTVCRRWREPDEGIWEIRGGRRHHTYSKAMCWVALDRLIRLHESGQLTRLPVDRFRQQREEIRQQVERRGYNEELGSYVTEFDGDDVDASLLLLGRYGYVEPRSERLIRTCARVHERLGRNGLLYRYRTDDGLPGEEGAFGICSFWAVDCLARQDELERAEARFDRLCSLSNDVGLYAEEIDPETGAHLGNFPQAFTHVGLIDAALTLTEYLGRGVAPERRTGGWERESER